MKASNISLNKDIYEFAAIKLAAANYETIAHIKVKEAPHCYLCEFSHCKYGEARTVREFCNHIIDLMNCRSGQSDLR